MTDCSHRPMPLALDGITADWLTAALRLQAPDITVRRFEIVDEIRGTSTKLRLRLDLDEAGRRAGIPGTVIVKGGFEAHSADMYYMYEREIRGFRDVWPILRLPSPKPYFADWDPDQRHGLVIMEDLVARGVEFCSALKPQTHEQVERRLTTLAEYHSKTWGSPEFLPGGRWDWIEEHLNALLIFVEEVITQEEWDRYLALPRGGAISTCFHDRHWGSEALLRVKALCQRRPQAIIHGDTHLGNLYIEPDGTPGFYDSLAGRAPPMMEVAYHITCALDLADRPKWECSLIQHYLDELRRHGVDAPAYDEAMYQYAIFLTFGYYIFLVNSPVFQTETINTAYAARFNAAMLEHDTYNLLRTVT